MIKCPHCGYKNKDNQVYLEQTCFDVVELEYSSDTKDINDRTVEEGHSQPADCYRCISCQRKMPDAELKKQLKEGR